jgi:BASS family bile acid:Na+ symporter
MITLASALMLTIRASIIALDLSLGLDAGADEVLHLVRRPAKLGRAFLAICVIVPATAVIVVQILPVIPPVKAGIVLMSLAPMPPIVPPRSLRLGAEKAYVYGVYVTFVVLAAFTVPITVEILNQVFRVQAHVPLGHLARDLMGAVLAPIAIGMFVRSRWPETATRLAPMIEKVSRILVTSLAVLIAAVSWREMIDLIGNGTLWAMIAIAAAGVISGHLLGGPQPGNRPGLASAAALRHPGIALMIAHDNFPSKKVLAAILLFTLVTVTVVAVYRMVLRHRNARLAAAEPPSPPR